jgi:spore coat protein YsxE
VSWRMSRFDDIFPLFREYDMYAQTVDVLKAPNVYKVMTPYGSFVCKRTQVSSQKLLLVSGVLRHLQQRGWDGAVPFFYTKYDEPYVRQGETTYYLTAWLPGGERWADQPLAWATPTVERLAELHHLTQNFRFDDPRQVEPLIDSLLNRWQHLLTNAEQAANLARERLYPSPFDVVFLANQAYVSELAQTAIARLREWRERHQTHAHFRLSLIHGSPHPAHILPDRSGKGKLLNFDRAVFDTPTRDLTLFYRTYFHMAGDEAGASQLFHHYANIFPLRPDEIDLLAVFLTYPERVMRDVEIYYGGTRDWSELYAVKRLEKDMDRLMRLNRWIQQAF